MTHHDPKTTGKSGQDPQWPSPIPSLITGLSVAAYYAVPDFVAGRGRRALAKTLVTIPAVVTTLSSSPTVAHHRTEGHQEEDARDIKKLLKTLSERPGVSAAIAAGGAAAVIGVAAGSEKLIYRLAEWRKGNGTTHAHTKNGAILGLAAAAGTYALDRFDSIAAANDLS